MTLRQLSLAAPLALLVGCTTVGSVSPSYGHAIARAAPMDASEMDTMVETAIREFELPALSIALIDDGAIVYDRKLGSGNVQTRDPITADSVFEMASLSKPVFAYLVMRMADRGVIDLDRPLHEYLALDELAHDARYKRITARMVLSHRSGFPNWRWFDPAPESWGIARGTMYMKADPGVFTYSGEAYRWLAEVLARRTGHTLLTLDELFQREMVGPLGLDHAAFVETPYIASNKVSGHEDGQPVERGWPRSFPGDTPQTFGAAGSLHTDAATYARFLVALMKGEGLSPKARHAMFAMATEVPPTSEMHRTSGEVGWTLGLAIKQGSNGRYFTHGGSNGDFKSGFAIDPATRDGFVFVTNSDRGDEVAEWLEQRFFG